MLLLSGSPRSTNQAMADTKRLVNLNSLAPRTQKSRPMGRAHRCAGATGKPSAAAKSGLSGAFTSQAMWKLDLDTTLDCSELDDEIQAASGSRHSCFVTCSGSCNADIGATPAARVDVRGQKRRQSVTVPAWK